MRKWILFPVVALMLPALVISGCARNMDANTYTSGAAVGKVLEGTVISAQPVTIKNTDKLENNSLGMLGGGVLGGVAGSGIGKGSGNALAITGAALAGAALGSVIQDKLGTNQGMQYVVRLDKKYVNQVPRSENRHRINVGQDSVDEDIKNSISVVNTQTDLISVVQGKDVVFQPGQRVLVIYNNDRPRLAANY